MAGLILISPSSSSLKFLSNDGLDEVVLPSLDIAESVTWTPRLSSSLTTEGDRSESGYSLKDDDFVRNNIPDINNNEKIRSRSHQRQQVAVYTALSEARRTILRSADGTALVQPRSPGSSSLSSTTSYLAPVGGLAPTSHSLVYEYFRTESGSPPLSSATAYHALVQRLNPNLHVYDRYPGQEILGTSNNGIRRVVLHPEKKKQKHHDVEYSAIEPTRVEGRQINVDDIDGQDESEKTQSLIHQLHGNARFAVQAALAQSARREQRQAVVKGGVDALARSGSWSGGWSGGGYKSAARAYIERAETWFGQDILIESLNQMIERQGHGTKSRKRKPQRAPISLTAPSPWSHSLPATQAMATVLNSPPKRAHSPDAMDCNKRRRSQETSSVVSTDGDGAWDHDDVEEVEEESQNERYDLETYASLLHKLIKGKSAVSSGEIQRIQTFVSSLISDTDLIIAARESNARTGTITNTDSDYETTIYQSILYIAKSSKGELGLAKNEEDKLRRVAKRVVSKT